MIMPLMKTMTIASRRQVRAPRGWFLLPMIGLSLILVSPATAQVNREAEREIRFAQSTLANDMPSSAVDLFRTFLENYPDGPFLAEARFGYARALELAEDSAAIEAYRDFLKNHPADANIPDARYGLARALYGAGIWPEARAAFSDFKERSPIHGLATSAGYYEGLSLVKMQRPLEAIPLFKAVVDSAADPLKGEASFSLAAAYYQGGQVDNAAEALSAVARSHAGSAPGYKAEGLLGDIFYRQGRFAEARKRYSKALEGNLAYADELMFWKAWSAVKSADTQVGLAELIQLAEKYPRSRRAVEAVRQAAVFSDLAGDTTLALKAYRTQIDLAPSPDIAAEARLERGRIYYRLLMHGEAATELSELLKLNASLQAEAEYLLGLIEIAAKRYPDALVYLKSAKQKSMNTPLEEDILIATLDLFRQSNNLGEYKRLLKELEERKSPALARIIRGGAELMEATGDMEGAAREYARVVDRFPSSPDALDAQFRVGMVRYQQARFFDAETSFAKFVVMTKNRRVMDHPLIDDAWYWIGFSRYQTDRMLNAIEAFGEAARMNGDKKILALFRGGNAAFSLKRYEDAIEAYEEVIDASETDKTTQLDAMFNRAEALRSLGRIPEAKKAFHEIWEKGGSDYEQALLSEAALLEDAGQFREAAEAYEAASSRFQAPSRSEEALLKAAIIRTKIGDKAGALLNFEKVTLIQGALAAEALHKIGSIKLEAGDTPGARAAFANGADSYPASLFGRRSILAHALMEPAADSTIPRLESLIAAAPGDVASAEAHLRLGTLNRALGARDTAISHLKSALDNLSDGDNLAEAKITLAEIYFEKKLLSMGRSQAQYIFRSELYRESPFRGRAGLILGRVLLQLGSREKTEALKVLKEVADKYPQEADKARDILKSIGS